VSIHEGEDGAYDDDYEADEKSPTKGAAPPASFPKKNKFLRTSQKKKLAGASNATVIVDKPTLTICVLNATLVSGTGVGASQTSQLQHQLSKLAVQVQVKNVPDASAARPSVTPLSGKVRFVTPTFPLRCGQLALQCLSTLPHLLPFRPS
jgi:hypothetical protein